MQKAFTQAKQRAGVHKVGGIHGLRHAYATHQLAAGLPVQRPLILADTDPSFERAQKRPRSRPGPR
ncbi:hypothetical protein [Thiorhodococcus minor]|uniref:hypothetical protein n=1 Tax=Thiorhodococcus minor TaxID=57489 RepID=UPI00247327E2|nr:hypothetical protein [Thiorhodococcus minor]